MTGWLSACLCLDLLSVLFSAAVTLRPLCETVYVRMVCGVPVVVDVGIEYTGAVTPCAEVGESLFPLRVDK